MGATVKLAGMKRMALLQAMAEAASVDLEQLLLVLHVAPAAVPADVCDGLIDVLSRLRIGYAPADGAGARP